MIELILGEEINSHLQRLYCTAIEYDNYIVNLDDVMLGKETSLRVAIPYTAMYLTLPAKLRTMEVTINNNLNLNHNIDYVCTKTISNTAFLQRNLSSCPGKRRSCVTQ